MTEQAEMKRNPDGTFTVTVGNKSRVFADCMSAASWADEQMYALGEEKADD